MLGQPCQCKTGTRLRPGSNFHFHAPGGGTFEYAGNIYKALPFRPGKTRKKRKPRGTGR